MRTENYRMSEAHFSLHALMVLKRRLLNTLGALPPGEKYYTLADARTLLSWPEEDCVAVWTIIEQEILGNGAYGLYSNTCPFCYRNLGLGDKIGCKNCAYGETHGNCNNQSSGWWRIMQNLMDNVPSNDDYTNMIHEIEKRLETRVSS